MIYKNLIGSLQNDANNFHPYLKVIKSFAELNLEVSIHQLQQRVEQDFLALLGHQLLGQCSYDLHRDITFSLSARVSTISA